MLMESDRLGAVEVDERSVISVPGGLLGFEGQERYVLVPADDAGAYSWFHSLDDPGLAFLVVVPGFFFDDYAPELSDADVAELGIEDPADAQVLCLVTIRDDAITANLLGPIVVNVANRRARQVVLADQGHGTRVPLGGG
jgi:flagellar assembly factor FliW